MCGKEVDRLLIRTRVDKTCSISDQSIKVKVGYGRQVSHDVSLPILHSPLIVVLVV